MIKNNDIADDKVIHRNTGIVGALETYKAPFWSLWQWAEEFSAGSSPLRYTSTTGQQIDNPADALDGECFDPQIKVMISTAKDYYGGLFFPSNEPWTVKPSYIDDLSIDEATAEECNTRINLAFNNPRSDWYEAREIFLDSYIRLGTGDLFGIETKDPSCPFKVRSFGLWGMSIGRGIEEQYQVLNWTAQQIVDDFGVDAIKDSDAIYEAYSNYDVTNTFKLMHLVYRNNEYSEEAKEGIKSKKYVGYWFLEDNKIIETVYYPEKPFSINRYDIRAGKLYGYSPLTNYKKSFQSLEGTFFLAMSALGKSADRRMGYFDLGSVGALELDSDAKFVAFNAGILGSGQSPIFPIDVGDVSGLLNVIRPEVLNGLRQAYRLDAMSDYFSQKSGNPRTATEVLAIENIKNKMMSPQVKRFADQMSSFRERITKIVLRSMADDKNYDMDNEVKKKIRAGKNGLFNIEETSIVKRIINSEKASQFTNDLQIIGAALQVQPSMETAIDLYDSTQNVLESGLIKLREKERYEEIRTQAENSQIETGMAGAREASANATIAENEEEA